MLEKLIQHINMAVQRYLQFHHWIIQQGLQKAPVKMLHPWSDSQIIVANTT